MTTYFGNYKNKTTKIKKIYIGDATGNTREVKYGYFGNYKNIPVLFYKKNEFNKITLPTGYQKVNSVYTNSELKDEYGFNYGIDLNIRPTKRTKITILFSTGINYEYFDDEDDWLEYDYSFLLYSRNLFIGNPYVHYVYDYEIEDYRTISSRSTCYVTYGNQNGDIINAYNYDKGLICIHYDNDLKTRYKVSKNNNIINNIYYIDKADTENYLYSNATSDYLHIFYGGCSYDKCKIHYLEIYQDLSDSTPARRMFPCINNNSKAGLYDVINKKFYTYNGLLYDGIVNEYDIDKWL